jgi:hypothetical protein
MQDDYLCSLLMVVVVVVDSESVSLPQGFALELGCAPIATGTGPVPCEPGAVADFQDDQMQHSKH